MERTTDGLHDLYQKIYLALCLEREEKIAGIYNFFQSIETRVILAFLLAQGFVHMWKSS